MIPHSRYFPIPRTATSAITKAILETHYPARAEFVAAAIVRRPTASWGSFSLAPTAGSVRVGVLRDPVERFRSACAATGKTVEQGLACLLTHPCFVPVSGLGARGVRWFVYETQFAEFCAELDIEVSDALMVSTAGSKPTLTAKQEKAVRAAYAVDVSLYAAVVATSLAIDEETPAPVPEAMRSWQAKAVLELTPHPQFGNLLIAAEGAIAAMPDGPTKITVLHAWNANADFARESPTIAALADGLGITSEQLDDLFRQGAALQV